MLHYANSPEKMSLRSTTMIGHSSDCDRTAGTPCIIPIVEITDVYCIYLEKLRPLYNGMYCIIHLYIPGSHQRVRVTGKVLLHPNFEIIDIYSVFIHTYNQSDVNTSRPRQNGRHFADDTFKHEFRLKFRWNLFLREQLIISLHWFR